MFFILIVMMALKSIHTLIFIDLNTHTHRDTHTYEINFMLLFVLFVALPCSLRDLSSPTRD